MVMKSARANIMRKNAIAKGRIGQDTGDDKRRVSRKNPPNN